jgi:hypothetical protein
MDILLKFSHGEHSLYYDKILALETNVLFVRIKFDEISEIVLYLTSLSETGSIQNSVE